MYIIKGQRADAATQPKKSAMKKALAQDDKFLSSKVERVILLLPQQYVKPPPEEQDLVKNENIDRPPNSYLKRPKTYKIDDQGDGEDPSYETAHDRKQRAIQNKRTLTITVEQLKQNLINLLEDNDYEISLEEAEAVLKQPKTHIKAGLLELCTLDNTGKKYKAKDSLFSKH